MTAPDVMGVAEIAQRLGLTPERARAITRGRNFPEATRLTAGRVWSTADVEKWIREHRR
jgi:predicted DNA-binding transcriptional regulator AlpA